MGAEKVAAHHRSLVIVGNFNIPAPTFWLNFQNDYDLESIEGSDACPDSERSKTLSLTRSHVSSPSGVGAAGKLFPFTPRYSLITAKYL
jgi:hypothetical protein